MPRVPPRSGGFDAYAVVRSCAADRKPKIRVEAGRGPVNVCFPQTHRPGAEAEVDFGEVAITYAAKW